MTQAMTTAPQRKPMHDRTRSAWLALTLAAFAATAGVVPAQTPDAKPASPPGHAGRTIRHSTRLVKYTAPDRAVIQKLTGQSV